MASVQETERADAVVAVAAVRAESPEFTKWVDPCAVVKRYLVILHDPSLEALQSVYSRARWERLSESTAKVPDKQLRFILVLSGVWGHEDDAVYAYSGNKNEGDVEVSLGDATTSSFPVVFENEGWRVR